MIKRLFISLVVLSTSVILQSTLFQYISFLGVTPDLSLIILIVISIQYGSSFGQLSGFFTGLVEDLVSLSPLGFHAFQKTITGFLYGLLKESFYIDPLIFPVILVSAGTVVKRLLSLGLIGLFSLPVHTTGLLSTSLALEVLYNAVLAPFIFLIVKKLIARFQAPHRGL